MRSICNLSASDISHIIHRVITLSFKIYLFFIFRLTAVLFTAHKMVVCVILASSDLLMGRHVDCVV